MLQEGAARGPGSMALVKQDYNHIHPLPPGPWRAVKQSLCHPQELSSLVLPHPSPSPWGRIKEGRRAGVLPSLCPSHPTEEAEAHNASWSTDSQAPNGCATGAHQPSRVHLAGWLHACCCPVMGDALKDIPAIHSPRSPLFMDAETPHSLISLPLPLI